MDASLVHTLK